MAAGCPGLVRERLAFVPETEETNLKMIFYSFNFKTGFLVVRTYCLPVHGLRVKKKY